MQIPCFWLEETGQVARWLRRYSRAEGGCNASYHNAMARVEDDSSPVRDFVSLNDRDTVAAFANDDRWPVKCEACEYVFTPGDEWQVFKNRLYRRLDTGEVVTLRDAPVGAMWDAWWMSWRTEHQQPDAIHLMVKCPGGEWYVDGKASNGPGWHRTGVPNQHPPSVTATPSIGIGENMRDYHGWLRNGFLVPA